MKSAVALDEIKIVFNAVDSDFKNIPITLNQWTGEIKFGVHGTRLLVLIKLCCVYY